MSTNPYEAESAAAAAAAASKAIYSSKALADEIRNDDAAMAEDLAALAPRSRMGRVAPNPHTRSMGETSASARASPHTLEGTSTFNEGAQRTARSTHSVHGPNSRTKSRNTRAADTEAHNNTTAALSFKENTTTEAYIDKTREVGLVRMSLAAKKTEIRKLEEDIDRAEKRLRQKQEQLESTREKFNSFLKYSNLEQDAAVRRADTETKAKQEKVVEIKKLSARMNHVELEIRKAQLQLESCRAYKKFLDNLAKPKWFQQVLFELRVTDRTEEILLETEETFEKRSAALEKAYHEAVKEREAVVAAASSRGGSGGPAGNARARRASAKPARRDGGTAPSSTLLGSVAEEDSLPEVVPLEVQVAALEREMAEEAQARVDAETARIHAEVEAMPLEDVKECLETQYDESRIPMYFKEVDELLEVFINVEEGNLFLIQNCQELEEELEGVAVSHLTEKTDTQAMTNQRNQQMQVLADKIAAAEGKLKQLEDRAAGLDRHVPVASAGATNSGSARGAGKTSSALSARGAGPAATDAGTAATTITPEMYRSLVEQSIGDMFRALNSGDTIIKQLTAQLQRQQQRHADTEKDDEQPQTMDDLGETQAGMAGTGAGLAASGKRTGSSGPSTRTSLPPKGKTASVTGPSKTKKGTHAAGTAGGSGAGAGGNQSHHNNNNSDAGANMGAVELLTIIENKIQEYQRFITDPANGVDEALIVSVMKNADKERRRKARLEHMAQQAQEHEERSRKALERSQAPVVRRVGKRVLRRSHATQDDGEGSSGFGASSKSGGGKGRRSGGGAGSRMDEDGAEFFV